VNPLLPIPGKASDLLARREKLRSSKQTLVLTNGCFDLLHSGHLHFLQEASRLGDELWVGLNSDASVQMLKGKNRPVVPEQDRAYALSSLRSVHAVFLFSNERLTDEILALKPDIYVKAGDYSLETIDAREKNALQSISATIRFIPFVEGYSTTDNIRRILQRNTAES